jgi:hypothetical protein
MYDLHKTTPLIGSLYIFHFSLPSVVNQRGQSASRPSTSPRTQLSHNSIPPVIAILTRNQSPPSTSPTKFWLHLSIKIAVCSLLFRRKSSRSEATGEVAVMRHAGLQLGGWAERAIHKCDARIVRSDVAGAAGWAGAGHV